MPLPDTIAAPAGAPAEVEAELARPEGERWHIRDPRSAEWVMRKLARARRTLTNYDDALTEYQAELEDWHAKATANARRTEQWATQALAAWAIAEREADPEARTQLLPSGTVSTRWLNARPEVTDAGAVASSLARGHHPAYDDVVAHEVRVDHRRLTAITQPADEWALVLSCGCAPLVWQLGETLGVAVGQRWPLRASDHEPGKGCCEPFTVTNLERRRTGHLVAVLGEEGSRVVIPIEGARVVPGRVSATVSANR